jgi:hypothetical protein
LGQSLQWSPPITGRMTKWPDAPLAITETLQWSPPVNGGRTSVSGCPSPSFVQPQWSPPIDGGPTDHCLVVNHQIAGAAMEPAGNRRDNTALPSPRCWTTGGRNGARR